MVKMKTTDREYFSSLKKKIASRLRERYPGNSPIIEDWKGEEIANFQQDLMEQVSNRVSEKWFYTHIKSDKDQVPRVDILNLLSRYAGYASWFEFKAKNAQGVGKGKVRNRSLLIGTPALLLLLAVISWQVLSQRSRTCEFCFYNAYTGEPIKEDLDLHLLVENESPLIMRSAEGCIAFETREREICLVVNSAYYLPDTVRRTMLGKRHHEQLFLKTNDYTQVIRMISNANVDDWNRKREQLHIMIADNAVIYQVFDKSGLGMEMYNKEEFIDRITLPVGRLRNLQILEVANERGKIKMLRFRTGSND